MNTSEQEILKQMILIYKPNGYDWMGTPITKDNPLTYHHIVKRKDGSTTIENGALLTKSSHKKLNSLEHHYPDLFAEWQWLFYAINISLTHPLLPYVEMMMELMDQTNELLYKSKQPTRTRQIITYPEN